MGSVSVVIIYGFLPLYTVLPSHDAADKIRVLNHFLNDRDLEELELEDLAGAATLAKELDAQMRALSEMLAHAGAQPREAEHVAQ